eukprot:12167417-Alexandrium_andersonii.AAC.1
MSASLVGSEMCIRDSAHRVRTGFPGNGNGCFHDLRASARMRRTFSAPVSYTHLTLPTICSV